MGWRLQPKQDFPFVAKFGVLTLTIVGVHETGMCYVTDTGDIAPFSVEPVEVAVEVPKDTYPVFATFREKGPETKKEWVRRGFFKEGPDAARDAAIARDGRILPTGPGNSWG